MSYAFDDLFHMYRVSHIEKKESKWARGVEGIFWFEVGGVASTTILQKSGEKPEIREMTYTKSNSA